MSGSAPLIHRATALRLGPAATAIARLVAAIAERPEVERWIVYGTPGRNVRLGHICVEPSIEAPVLGTVYGVFTRRVTLEQLVDDLAELADEGAGAC